MTRSPIELSWTAKKANSIQCQFSALFYSFQCFAQAYLFCAFLTQIFRECSQLVPARQYHCSIQVICHRNLTISNENWENITKYNNGWNSTSFPPASSVVVNSSFVLADIFELGDHWRTRDGAPCHRVFQPRPTWPGLKKCCLLSGKVSRKNVAHLLDFI